MPVVGIGLLAGVQLAGAETVLSLRFVGGRFSSSPFFLFQMLMSNSTGEIIEGERAGATSLRRLSEPEAKRPCSSRCRCESSADEAIMDHGRMPTAGDQRFVEEFRSQHRLPGQDSGQQGAIHPARDHVDLQEEPGRKRQTGSWLQGSYWLTDTQLIGANSPSK